MELTKELIKKEVLSRKSELLTLIKDLVQIKSYTGDVAGVRKAVDHMATLGEKEGFTSKIIFDKKEGLSMHLHHGDEKDFVGVLGHLDTVPVVQEQWDFDAHSGDVVDGFIMGRGSQDDKGPMAAAYIATKIIRDLELPVSRGVRLIYGTQEEGGNWTDIEHYFSVEKKPSISFTPDAYFPLIFAEKGIVRVTIKGKIENAEGIILKSGTVPNAVPSSATLIINGEEKIFEGKALHASKAYKGVDSALFKAITHISKTTKNTFFKFLNEKFVDDTLGAKINLDYSTELEGPLSINLGVFEISENGEFSMIFDVRWPSRDDKSHEWVKGKITKAFTDAGFEIESGLWSTSEPLFVSPESYLVKTLQKSYDTFTKGTEDEAKPMTTGGGTYARALGNCVGFGGIFPTDAEVMHEKNEKHKVDSLLRACMIYVDAIYNLMK